MASVGSKHRDDQTAIRAVIPTATVEGELADSAGRYSDLSVAYYDSSTINGVRAGERTLSILSRA